MIQKRHRIEVGDSDLTRLVLVGCGGTGSFTALHLARLAWVLGEKGQKVELVFIDPDRVEEKNIGRQNFVAGEIGRNKAEALAWRYSAAFGLAIRPLAQPFTAELGRRRLAPDRWGKNLTVLIGAVDNPAARRELAGMDYTGRVWWLDAGNGRNNGQVLIGNAEAVRVEPGGFASAAPLPSVQEPELLVDEGLPEVLAGPSCADLLVQEAQSLMINTMMAAWIGVYATRLLLSRDLDMQATYLDLQSGAARSVGVSGQAAVIEQAQAKPERVTTTGLELAYDADTWNLEELLEIEERICPVCGGQVADGRHTIDGDETGIVFCPECNWMIPVDHLGDLIAEAAETVEATE
jgi:PRTRC genetic system ThiF family protein